METSRLAAPPIPQDSSTPKEPPSGSGRARRGSFSFLRRSKSREDRNAFNRSASNASNPATPAAPPANNKLVKGGSRRRKSLSADQRPQDSAPAAPAAPPQLPTQLLPQAASGGFYNNTTGGLTTGSAISDDAQSLASTSTYTDSRNLPISQTFARGNYPPTSYSASTLGGHPYHSQPMASTTVGDQPATGSGAEKHSRQESMTHRGRYSYGSYASSISGAVNNPRRMRRRHDPTPFNILVVGAKNSGKTSFIEFLRTALKLPQKQQYPPASPAQTGPGRTGSNPSFNSHYLETELDGERIGLTLYDSKGLEKHIVDLQLREISAFLESKFQETFNEESKVMRATGVRDTHIHCVFLVLDPARLDSNVAASNTPSGFAAHDSTSRYIGGLDEKLDVNLIQALQGKTTVIPVISKADTVTTAHMSALKRIVWDSFKKMKFDPLEVLNLDDESDNTDSALQEGDEDEEDDDKSDYEGSAKGDANVAKANGNVAADAEGNPAITVDGVPAETLSSTAPQHPDIRLSTLSENVDLPYLPLSIISPDVYEPGVIGRRFPWGFADPYNADHCDFVKLKENVFSEWRAELRAAAREKWYENWRTSRLKRRAHQPQASVSPRIGQSSSGNSAATANNNSRIVSAPAYTQQQNRPVRESQIGLAVSNGYD